MSTPATKGAAAYSEDQAKAEIREALGDLKRLRAQLAATKERLQAMPACRETEARRDAGDEYATSLADWLRDTCEIAVMDHLDVVIEATERDLKDTHATIKAWETRSRKQAAAAERKAALQKRSKKGEMTLREALVTTGDALERLSRGLVRAAKKPVDQQAKFLGSVARVQKEMSVALRQLSAQV